ncbi:MULTISPECIES: 4-carboxy-4-hydroxy-2-oxoadipate aldolase/oxaloacetate decarboxylase [unclassified Microbacterium]|uniref:4-carboxy-4-hydroxy-2-oxoadipate aldolase/oxaloacetate decarboxylase n=1 Tax=unclassified Microbacterium TaxID=2609290 RepID=UPI00097F1876|nr:4-carboxy-4-hydroxy-2-oxoadipate aldolase/oxaloacetate decarboxylase [Microbacterium sp. JB110]RCS61373.1 4-carboxy-4-hydroxy-2-oxoadipate aldolase/oxaloacetate decarboxylase [Microbacterium sp. JB110]SJM50323.1 4-carboxy-4-hydroxy-2-oxoadipate aldolase [Frigoribacterium sp. JB110]
MSSPLGIVVTDIRRGDAAVIARLAEHGVATVHEAQGRVGLVGPGIRPIQQGARIGGSAVTVLSWPGDNLMIHAAIEQCEPGDVLVVATTSGSADGAFGDLFATALKARGVLGLVTETGVRDTADLREMDFPVWSNGVHSQGTVKATAGSVNVSVTVGGQLIRPGDIVIADDDGIVCVPREGADAALEKSDARQAKEDADREAYGSGAELSLDRKGLRTTLEGLGVRYMSQEEYGR